MSQSAQSPTQHAQPDSGAPSIAPVVQEAMFWQPEYQAESPWLEHLPVLFWLVQALKPSTTVGLGADLVSHFSVCQALSTLQVNGSGYVVCEDPHKQEGFLVEPTHQRYAGFSQWLLAKPAHAAQQFEQKSVDLVLVNMPLDDDVDHLVDCWLPRLSDKGVIVLPGIARREPGCRAFRAFEQLADRYPYFSFYHGSGLGLLVLGEAAPRMLKHLLEAGKSAAYAQTIRNMFVRLGQGCADGLAVHEQRALTATLQDRVEVQQKQIADFEEQFHTLTQTLAEREQAFSDKQLQVAELVDHLQQYKDSITARFEELGQMARVQQQTEQALEKAQQQLNAAEQQIQIQEQQQAQLQDQLTEEQEVQKEQRRKIERQHFEINELVERLESQQTSPQNPAAAGMGAAGSQPAVAKPKLSRRAIRQQVSLIEKSGWFDAGWYLQAYPDLANDKKASAKPARHYLLIGGFEGRNPGPDFNSVFYLAQYPDVVQSGMNPLVHYLKFGEKEQRRTKG